MGACSGSGGGKDFMGEVMMWLNPRECVLEASWILLWPVWEWEYIF